VSALVIHNLMEITIEDLPLIDNTLFVVANLHGWWSLSGDQVEPLTLLLRLLRGSIQRRHGGVPIQSCLLGTQLVVPARVLLTIGAKGMWNDWPSSLPAMTLRIEGWAEEGLSHCAIWPTHIRLRSSCSPIF
jgi:hypothetical protein